MKLLHKGTVKDHKLIFDNPEAFSVAKAQLEGKRVEVTIEKETLKRTSQQNRYLWGVVYPLITKAISDYANDKFEAEQIHDMMKAKFASKHLDKDLIVTEQTSKMDTVRFTEYIEDIRRWSSAFLGLNIPDANSCEEL
jgi:hypothetical protein